MIVLLLLGCTASSKDSNALDSLSSVESRPDDTGAATWATGKLSLHMVDVGQGDSLLLVGPSGHTLLLDAGEDDAWDDHLEDYLNAHAVQGLDFTVVSHMHSDHLGAMDRVLEDHPEVIAAYDNGRSYDSTSYDWYVQRAVGRRQTVSVGDTIPLDPQVTIEVLHADVGDAENENNNSVVLKVTFGAVRLLLGGDCESSVCEREIHPGSVDVYKVHHHGSSDSSDRALLSEMSPSYALIPVGARNDYGHPHDETLDALEAVGAEVWRSDLDGDVVVQTDGQTITVTGSE